MEYQDTYKEVRTFTYPNAIVRVHIPDITKEEREKRMRCLYRATENLMKEVYRNAKS